MFPAAYHNGKLAMMVHRLAILAIAALLMFCTITLADASRRWTDFKVMPVSTSAPVVLVEPEPKAAPEALAVNYRLVGPRRLREIVRLVTPDATKVAQASYQP